MEVYLWWKSLHIVQKSMLIFFFCTPCELLINLPEDGLPLVDVFFLGMGSWIMWNGFN